MIELGRKYKDKITGFEGVVTGQCQYISGCNQALLAPAIGEDGAFKEAHWFDVQRLEIQDGEPVVLDNGAIPGCDKAAACR